ncbi:MAG: hypothetical protein V3U71_08230 [Cocleimonas sp.]
MKNFEPKKTNILWTIVAFLVLAFFFAAAYKFKDILNPVVSATAVLDDACDLRKGACTSTLSSGGTITFSISPNNIPILRPLKLEVKVDGIEVSKTEVDFIGIGMEMGYNRSKLESKAKTLFAGSAILPVCIHTKMDWEARVLLHTDDGLIMVPFRFFTLK